MYKEVLHRDWVLEHFSALRDWLDEHLQNGGEAIEHDGVRVAREDLYELSHEMTIAHQEEETAGVRPGHSPIAYLPSNSFISNFQGRFEQCVRSLAETAERAGLGEHLTATGTSEGVARTGVAPDSDLVSDDLPAITNESIHDAIGRAASIKPFDPFEPCDPRWLTIGLAIGWRRFHGWTQFNPRPASFGIAQRCRLVILSDWATGLPRARRVAAWAKKAIEEPEMSGRECHVLHLGDVYYAGWPDEQRRNVLDCWPVEDGNPALSWALPGNHDYYSGGFGFFETLLGNPRFQRQVSADGKSTSLLDLQNDQWRILGLDTSYVDHDLGVAQLKWIEDAIAEAKSRSQAVILLSHHQPWSSFLGTPEQTQLWKKMRPALESSPAFAWFWGHEHRLTLYKPTREIQVPRCVGDCGVPEFVTGPEAMRKPNLVEFDFEEKFRPHERGEHFRRFAFVIADLDGDTMTLQYVNELGERLPSESFTARG